MEKICGIGYVVCFAFGNYDRLEIGASQGSIAVVDYNFLFSSPLKYLQ